MTDHPDIVKRLTSTSVVIGNLPELPGYNGSVLTIDDEEAARCAADIDAGISEITRLREDNKKLSDKAEALRKDAARWRFTNENWFRFTNENWFQFFEPTQHWKVTTATGKVLHEGLARTYEAAVDAAIAATTASETKEQQA